MSDYFVIKKFDECLPRIWDDFCLNSKDAWLWHTSHSIVAKTFWENHFNYSFFVIDESNKNKIVAIFPIFLIRRRKIVDYSSFDSLGGPAFCNSLNGKKFYKLIKFINKYLIYLLKSHNVNQLEILKSTLADSIINQSKIIPNPLGLFISNDLSSFTWIKNLKKESNKKIFRSFDYNTRNLIQKSEKTLKFSEVKKKEISKTLDIFYLLHLEMAQRKKIKPKKKAYFEYIFFKFPEKKRKIFVVRNQSKIISISIFGIFKNNAIYWINASSNNALKIGGNHFLMWESLKYFKKMRFQFFEFGEGFFENNTNHELLNLNHFKKSFGGEKYPLFRGKKTISIFKDMSISFLRFIFKKI